jgi:outer membrane biosynthesis protein TonB
MGHCPGKRCGMYATPNVCLPGPTVGGLFPLASFQPSLLENKMNKLALPAALLFAMLTLSACATKPKEETAEPAAAPVAAQPAAVAEPAPAPAPAVEVAAEPAPAPVASTQEEAPKPVVKKAKRKVAKAAPKVVEPAPVAAPVPAPVAEPAPVAAPAMMEAPIAPVEEQGFLAKYWAWLLGIIVAAIAIVFMMRKKD